MSKGILHDFYRTEQWQRCRDAYIRSVGGLCERCRKRGIIAPAEIAHHVKHLTPQNVTDPEVSLNPDNLMAVCRACHAELHPMQTKRKRRYKIDSAGRVIAYHADA